MASKQKFLVAKEKLLVALVTVSVTISSPELYKFVRRKLSLPGNRIQTPSLSLVHTYMLLRNHVKTIDDALNLPTMVMLTVALCPVPTLLIGTQVYTPSVSTVMLSTPELLLLIKESLR